MSQFEQRWIERFVECGALQMHDGDTGNPHIVNRYTGAHMSLCFMAKPFTQRVAFMELAARHLKQALRHEKVDFDKLRRVVGVDEDYGLTLAYSLAKELGCDCGYHESGYHKLNEVVPDIYRNENILLFEDWLTYDRNAISESLLDDVKRKQANLLPYIVCLFNGSGREEIGGRKIIALVHRVMNLWDITETCRLCQEGSPIVYADDIFQPAQTK